MKKRSSASDKFKSNAGLSREESLAPRGGGKTPASVPRPGPSGFRKPETVSSPIIARNTNPQTKANPFRHEERAERGANAPLHRPVAHAVVAALTEIMVAGRYADKVIERAFKSEKNMGGRDRKAFAEMVYETVRWWRRYASAVGWDTEHPPYELTQKEIWKWLGAHLVEKSVRLGNPPTLPTWEEFKSIDPKEVANRLSDLDPVRDRAVFESVPEWMDALGEKEIGAAKWPSILHALNLQAPVVLRANTLKCTRDELIARLKEENGINSQPALKTANGIVLSERKNVFTTEAFKAGWFEVQDGASQQIAEILDAKPGERVIDACAGAGGKTLAIGAMMKNKGRLLSLDVEERKLQELRRRVARAGVDTSEAKMIDSAKVIKRLEGTADKVLLDVPCTGLGVVRRNPDKKWKLKPDDLERLRVLQAQILDEYSLMAKPGGVVVYATCSFLPSENRGQIDTFLNRQGERLKTDPTAPKFDLISDRNFAPGENNYDGFYAAVLKRTQ